MKFKIDFLKKKIELELKKKSELILVLAISFHLDISYNKNNFF